MEGKRVKLLQVPALDIWEWSVELKEDRGSRIEGIGQPGRLPIYHYSNYLFA